MVEGSRVMREYRITEEHLQGAGQQVKQYPGKIGALFWTLCWRTMYRKALMNWSRKS